MRPRRTLSRVAAAGALALAAVAGCGRPEGPAPGSAEAAALHLFAIARDRDPADEELTRAVDELPRGAGRAALEDALTELGRVRDPRVVAVEPRAELDHAAVEVVGLPASGGSARYTFDLVRRPDGEWRLVWLAGPGFVWPAGTERRGSGLTSSPADGAEVPR